MSYQFNPDMICPWDITADAQRIAEYRDYYRIKHDILAGHLQRLALDRAPRILEIGVRAGYSADAFLQACPAHYIGLDADNGQHGGAGPKPYLPWAKDWLARFKDAVVSLHWPVDSQRIDALTEFAPEGADFYHIDGDHTKIGVRHDLHLCWHSARPGALILVDDYDHLGTVRDGVNGWLQHNPCRWEYRKSLRGEILIWR